MRVVLCGVLSTYILVSDLDSFDAGGLDGLFQVLGEKLLLLVEVVSGTLKQSVSTSRQIGVSIVNVPHQSGQGGVPSSS